MNVLSFDYAFAGIYMHKFIRELTTRLTLSDNKYELRNYGKQVDLESLEIEDQRRARELATTSP